MFFNWSLVRILTLIVVGVAMVRDWPWTEPGLMELVSSSVICLVEAASELARIWLNFWFSMRWAILRS